MEPTIFTTARTQTARWRPLTFDLLEQTATPTSGIQAMFWTAPEPATAVCRTEPSCHRAGRRVRAP